jgi:hypothetical protein
LAVDVLIIPRQQELDRDSNSPGCLAQGSCTINLPPKIAAVILGSIAVSGIPIAVPNVMPPPWPTGPSVPISGSSCVLVDHRGQVAVVPHPGHQVPERGAALRRELVARVSEIVEVQARHADGRDGVRPAGHLVEVARRIGPPLTLENTRARLVPDEHRQVVTTFSMVLGPAIPGCAAT